MCTDLVALEQVRQRQMPYCLPLACNDVDFILQVEIVLSRELLDGFCGEFSELRGSRLVDCDHTEDHVAPTWMLTMDISSGDVLFVRIRCITRSGFLQQQAFEEV